ncbi:MAG: VPLPA-CTERM sorting domain-containing protein [Rhodospirillales bacterium]|nr:VPLPA-CTERM sorting domain-containing protein [Rhodospirillales bacterium]
MQRRSKDRSFNNKMLAAAFAGGLAFLGVRQVEAGTILTQDGTWSTNQAIPDGYGDRVPAINSDANYSVYSGAGSITGTPNIEVDFVPGDWDIQTYENWSGRGSVIQVEDYTFDATSAGNDFVFTPDAGADVSIVSVDLDNWAGGGDIEVEWEVIGSSSGSLASGSWFNSGGRETINIGATGAGSETLTLNIDIVGSSGYAGSYFAIDNLNFDQIGVPEPASAVLSVGGLGLMAMRRRRR